uniref:DUF4220 domain-containing protein n=1 Tax=Aegilops tauschii TaxID=37682 RepID=M8BJK6_AEGTA
MGFSGALQWWDEWHLRVLALGSLFIQYFLFVSGTVRRRALPAWLRLFIWLAYLGGDALAIYALATLFNRRSQLPGDGSGSGLEVVWAPVLLVHLGGQHNMTAYSIQDTELWMRHAITVASQVSVALYVFCKLWSGEKGLLQAAILMFVFGIIRSCQKPWALKSASISAIASSSATLVPSSPSALRKQGMVALFWQVCTCGYGYGFQSTGFLEAVAEEKDILPQEFAKEARKCVLESELAHDQDKAELLAEPSVEMYVNMVLGDIPVPYSTRIKILQRFMALDFPHAYHLSDCMFLLSFLLLYTRKTILISRLGLCLHLLLPFLALASVVILFSTGHKYLGYKYNMTDVKDGWKQHIHNADSYRRFNSRGGHWTLRKRRLRRLRWSLNMAFDRSVLLWHIATELCYGSTTNRIPECVQGSMVISNYMAYLLCIHPEMLMPGTRSSIFTFACHDVELMLGHESSLGDLVPNAHRLHYQLLELHDEGERWEVVQGVWVEMLCYSASRCRGYLHAKSLSEGVELLSRVWLLLLFMGMETFADRFQRPFTRREVHDDDAGRTDENEINISIV